jgi:ureidoglycolate hydrolase
MIEIALQGLSRDKFSPYGEVYLIPAHKKFDSSGEGWECWYPLGKVEEGKNTLFGIVKCQPMSPTIHLMERHKDRVEYLIALDQPIIQTVGLSSPTDPDAPDESQTEAFVIYPGQIARVNRGVWHAPALPLGPDVTQYLFLLGEPGKESGDPDSGLTRFTGRGGVHVIVPDRSG